MKVILLADIKGKGKRGSVDITVAHSEQTGTSWKELHNIGTEILRKLRF